jgi:hypothetical protein
MEQAVAASKAEVEQLNQKKEQIQKGKEGLNNALKNIKTRFGKLGLEVEDAILLAPVAFAALFLFAALNLCQNIQLRNGLREIHSLLPVERRPFLLRLSTHTGCCQELWRIIRGPELEVQNQAHACG